MAQERHESSLLPVPIKEKDVEYQVHVHVYIHVTPEVQCSSFFLGKVTALGVLCCFTLFFV